MFFSNTYICYYPVLPTVSQETFFREVLIKYFRLPDFEKINIEHRSKWIVGRIVLLYSILKDGVKIPFDDIKYSFEGKPFLSTANLSFNLSHSNRCTALISSFSDLRTMKLGIDIEYKKEFNFKKFSRSFTKDEWSHIEESLSPLSTFYNLWSRKEAVIKAKGRGLILLPKISVLKNECLVEGEIYKLYGLENLCRGFVGCISSNKNLKNSLIHINLSCLEKYFNTQI